MFTNPSFPVFEKQTTFKFLCDYQKDEFSVPKKAMVFGLVEGKLPRFRFIIFLNESGIIYFSDLPEKERDSIEEIFLVLINNL